MDWFKLIELILFLIALFFVARWFLGVGVGAPYVPVPSIAVPDGMELAQVSAADVVVDLGSGDGKVLIAAAQRGARVIGYELNPFLVWLSRWRLRKFKDRVHIYRMNLFDADLSAATIVFVFQLTKWMPKTQQMLSKYPTLLIVSFAFDFPDWQPVAIKGMAKLYRANRH